MLELTVIGGRGYTGEILLGYLANHPAVHVARIGSRSLAGRRVGEVFPGSGLADLGFSKIEPADCARETADAVILALPNGGSEAFVAELDPSVVVIDLSADHRFDDSWIYGLPELGRERLAGARRIANPGCYATGAQLALAPVADRLAAPPAVFGVSGYSGAGRTPSPRNDPGRLADNLLAYQLTGHVHEREISARLGQSVRFMPHVAAWFRGISLTVAVTLEAPVDEGELAGLFGEAYAGERLIEVVPEPPEVRSFAGRPSVGIGGFSVDRDDPRCAVWVACLDNLLKGAATQAMQNLNLAFGLDEYLGIADE